MLDRLRYFFSSKAVIITGIVLGALVLIGASIWGGMKLLKKDDNIVYYSFNGFFIDDYGNFVSGVIVKVDGKEAARSNSNGSFKISYIKEGSKVSFEISGYSLENPDEIVINKNIYNMQINLISDGPKIKQFIARAVDENGAVIAGVTVKSGNKNIGTTNSKGEIRVSIDSGETSITFSHTYFDFDNQIVFKYEDDVKVTKEIVGVFNRDNYFKPTVDEEGNSTVREFKVGFSFRTIDGEIAKKVTVYYKLKDSSTFNYQTGLDLYLEKEFTSAFAYYYNETTNTWYCSEIIKPSPIGTTIYLKEAIHIDAKINLQDPPSLRTIFTSNGYYFLSDKDGNIEIVLPSYQDIQFYHDMEYGKYPKYEVILVDSEGNPITEVEGNISNVNFIIK